ncbi:MAG TPA: hypothetical protein VGF80_01095 [Galbitalea sp.]|jgi:hypothetical protein
MKFLEVVRLAYGIVLIAVPAAALDSVATDDSSLVARRVVRILGARHVVQAIVTMGRGRIWHQAGAGVDLLHAGSAAVFALVKPEWRGPAAVSSLVSLALGAGEIQ